MEKYISVCTTATRYHSKFGNLFVNSIQLDSIYRSVSSRALKPRQDFGPPTPMYNEVEKSRNLLQSILRTSDRDGTPTMDFH